MPGTRNPLDAAFRVRQAERMRAETDLAQALRDAERTEAALAHASAVVGAHMKAASATAAEQPGRRSRAFELQRTAAFAQRQSYELRRLRADLAVAEAHANGARRAVERAQTALAHALAQEQAVERERARLAQAERRAHDAAEQDEQDDRAATRRKDRRPE